MTRLGRFDRAMFDAYLERWGLVPDGPPAATHSSRLLPVLHNGAPAMLKLAYAEEERRGATLMQWWNGDGAARVLERQGDALLIERACGPRSLSQMAREGHDDEASLILCAAAARLHVPRPRELPELDPLALWFAELAPAAARHGGILADASAMAQTLLAESRDVYVLHGDLHHGNVLDFGARGWLAIDPKGLIGERGFDFASIFCNPDFAVATAPGRLARQVNVVAKAASLDHARLLRWILAYAGLSAAWTINEGDDARRALAVGEIAAAEIARG